MALTNCTKRAHEGVLDMEYIERRLDVIEARIDDLCWLLGQVLDALGVEDIETVPEKAGQTDLNLDGVWSDDGH